MSNSKYERKLFSYVKSLFGTVNHFTMVSLSISNLSAVGKSLSDAVALRVLASCELEKFYLLP